jgi:hypothetical protein
MSRDSGATSKDLPEKGHIHIAEPRGTGDTRNRVTPDHPQGLNTSYSVTLTPFSGQCAIEIVDSKLRVGA